MDFMKLYQAQCRERFGHLGFKKLGNTHWRVVNDVLQTFYLHRARAGGSCMLQFGITPLCYGSINRDSFKYGTSSMLQPHAFSDCTVWQWFYDPKSEESIRSCIESLMEFMLSYLVPYFERGIDCASARKENLMLWQNLLERKRTFLRDNPWARQYSFGEEPTEEKALGSMVECYMALKIGVYADAAKYLSNLIAARRKANEAEPSEKNEKFIAEWSQLLERALAQDNDFFADYLAANERKSRIALGLEKE